MYERTYHKSVLKQVEVPKEPRPFPWKRLLIIFGVLLILIGLIFLIRLPGVQVRSVTVEGTHVEDPEALSAYVLSLLEGNTFYVFPKTSNILLSPGRIKKNIKADFPRFETVSVSKDSLHSLVVRVTEYDGRYLWCQNEEECYFMDKGGIVFAGAPYFSGSAYIKIFKGELQSLPFTPLTAHEHTMIETLIDRLRDISIDPASFTVVSENQLNVTFARDGYNAHIYFNTKADLEESLEVLYSGMRVESFDDVYRNKTKVLKYIDLRFSNKMVYKFD